MKTTSRPFLKLRFTFSFLDQQTYVILAGQFQSSSCFIRSSRERTHTHKIFVHKNEQEFLTIWVGMMRQEKNKIAWRSSNVIKLTLPQDSDQQISLNWRNVGFSFSNAKFQQYNSCIKLWIPGCKLYCWPISDCWSQVWKVSCCGLAQYKLKVQSEVSLYAITKKKTKKKQKKKKNWLRYLRVS